MVDYSEIEEFSSFKRTGKAKIIKYIELCFDKDSPLNQIQNFRERQLKAAKKAKMDITDDNTLTIIDFRDMDVNVLINAFLGKINNSNLYDSLMSNQFLFWSIQEAMRMPVDSAKIKDRTELSKQSEIIEKRIADLSHKIYGSEELEEMGAKVVRMSYEQRITKSDVS